ncbi:MAG: hypothetical protein KGI71_05715 [Patescibacteria group bacterium]|nr:hypothetical protein [Patescibacteria group bacterium]
MNRNRAPALVAIAFLAFYAWGPLTAHAQVQAVMVGAEDGGAGKLYRVNVDSAGRVATTGTVAGTVSVVSNDGGIPVNVGANVSVRNEQHLVLHYTDGGCETLTPLINRKTVTFQNLSTVAEVYVSFDGTCPAEGAITNIPARPAGVSGVALPIGYDYGANIPVKLTSTVNMTGDAGLIISQSN